MKPRLSILLNQGFIAGLIILLTNDFILKSVFPGFITGKLSDIAGLFIFPIFLFSLGFNHLKGVYYITAAGFVWWKSVWSTSFILFINGLSAYQIQRVVDYSDLLAILILPVSYQYLVRIKDNKPVFNPTWVVMLTLFGLYSTSMAPKKISYKKTYSFQYSYDTLQSNLFFHPAIWNGYRDTWLDLDSLQTAQQDTTPNLYQQKKDSVFNRFFMDTMRISIDGGNRFRMTACLVARPNRKLSQLTVLYLEHPYFDKPNEYEDSVILMFEEKFIKPLYE